MLEKRLSQYSLIRGAPSAKTESVFVKEGGDDPAVEPQSPTSLDISMNRKSSAENEGLRDIREERH